MFASPNQVPKCHWLRKRLYRLNKSMGTPVEKRGDLKGESLFPALPSHPQTREVNRKLHARFGR